MKLRTIQIISLSALILFTYELSFSGYKLRYKFDLSKKYRYSLTVENKTTGQAMGKDFLISTQTNIEFTVSSGQSKGSELSITITINKLKSKINFPMMGFNDSTVVMKEWVRKRFKLVLNELGKVVSTTLLDSVPPSRVQMIMRIDPMEIVKRVFIELPAQVVDVKETWNKSNPDTLVQMGMGIVVKPNLRFTFDSIEKMNNLDCCKILLSGTSTMEGTGSTRGIDITLNGSTKENGNYFFAQMEGLPVNSSLSSESDITQTMSGRQIGVQTMTIINTAKLKLLK